MCGQFRFEEVFQCSKCHGVVAVDCLPSKGRNSTSKCAEAVLNNLPLGKCRFGLQTQTTVIRRRCGDAQTASDDVCPAAEALCLDCEMADELAGIDTSSAELDNGAEEETAKMTGMHVLAAVQDIGEMNGEKMGSFLDPWVLLDSKRAVDTEKSSSGLVRPDKKQEAAPIELSEDEDKEGGAPLR